MEPIRGLHRYLTPAAESPSRFKRERMNAPTFGRDVAPLGLQSDATGFACGAPQIKGSFCLKLAESKGERYCCLFPAWLNGPPVLRGELFTPIFPPVVVEQ